MRACRSDKDEEDDGLGYPLIPVLELVLDFRVLLQELSCRQKNQGGQGMMALPFVNVEWGHSKDRNNPANESDDDNADDHRQASPAYRGKDLAA